MSKEKRLGRGLEALLGRLPAAPEPTAPSPESPAKTKTIEGPYGSRSEEPYGVPFGAYAPPQVQSLVGRAPATEGGESDSEPSRVGGPLRVNISQIDSNPSQPRQEFDDAETRSLAESLSAHGLLQPVVVRRTGARYQLIAGERRLRAAIKAGWIEVPVQVVEADDRQVAELAIIENLHRRDLNPLEKAASFQRFLEQYGCTQEELASRLMLDRSTIANLIRLLELPEPVQAAVRRGEITQGHARALLPLGDEQEQLNFCRRIQKEELSVRQTEAIVQETIQSADEEPLAVIGRDGSKSKPSRGRNEHLAALEQQFRAALGLKVSLRQSARGRGKLTIHFRNHEEFDRLRSQLCDSGGSEAQVG